MIDQFFASSFAKATDDKKATKGKEKMGRRFLWLLLIGSLSAAGYLGANAWGALWSAKDVQSVWGAFWSATNVRSAFDNCIPFVPNAIIAYLLIFPFLLTPVFLVKKYSDFVLVVGAYAVLVLVSVAIFFWFPTTMARPNTPVYGFVGWLFGGIRAVDGEYNLFPSLHVSSVVFVALVNGFFCSKAKWPSWVCAVLISASTLFVKQHAVVDVLGGAVFGASAYILLRRVLTR